ncbi:hypothetical protein K505DRAFT_329479 [Melanomma pulvis-pyrius CBS 109.77]|uniref:Uncharacterized protein n=1 Tax=Melanomma pulvis-pyrius CBS 109.77 TaxID=1314802 RepID=A0A6A6WV17_9PLEO|nr:hypothetical protein K505DRAFT_329479 [Melanomma pulvis-pyrius CBS 109.77]
MSKGDAIPGSMLLISFFFLFLRTPLILVGNISSHHTDSSTHYTSTTNTRARFSSLPTQEKARPKADVSDPQPISPCSF